MYNCLNVPINVQFVKQTSKVHDYRIQKINHLKWFERLTILSINVVVMFVIVESVSLKNPLRG